MLGAVAEKVTSYRGKYTYIISKIILNTFLDRAVAGSCTVIIAYQSLTAVCIWSNDSNCFDLLFVQRQDPIVFQKYEAFFSCFLGKRQMGR